MAWLQAAYVQFQGGLTSVAAVLILVVGGMQTAAGHTSLGNLLSFFVCLTMLGKSVNQISAAIPQVIAGAGSLRGLRGFLTTPAPAPYSGRGRPQMTGAVELRSVCFSYASTPLLKDVTLRLEAGSLTAIVGPNGSGKTTLTRLLFGFYRPESGRVSMDGYAYEDLDVNHLRQSIAVAPQDPILFPGTIRENLEYGLDEAQRLGCPDACRLALVDEFVAHLPEGYETAAGEDGTSLSGGQRQKIAIARALARKPRLLILDEPTNHLDPDSVRQLVKNIQRMENRPTVLIITQNQAVAAEMPLCVRLENGRMLAQPEDVRTVYRPSSFSEPLPEEIHS